MSDLRAACVCRWILITLAVSLIFSPQNGHCCGRPEEPEDGYFVPPQNKYLDGSRVTYTCNDGFSLKVSQEMQKYNYCMKGRWNNTSPPVCAQNPACGDPGIPENGVSSRDLQRNLVRYTCKPGYIMLGNSVRACSRDMVWTPQELPKCVTNLAYLKTITQINVVGNAKSIVDGDSYNCVAEVKTKSFEVKIDLGWITDFTNILVSFKNGSKIAVGLISSNQSTSLRDRRRLTDFTAEYVTAPLWFNTSTPPGPARLERARYISLEPLNGKDNSFALCEIQMFNSLESLGCGKPDEPLNGKVINISYPGSSLYRYECNYGYFREGYPQTQCNNGRWSAPPPTCKPNPTTTSRLTTRPTVPTTRPFPTPSRPTPHTPPPDPTPTKEHDDDDKEKVIGIMAIAIGATAASLFILATILIVVCVLKRYYKKKSRLPPCHAEHGPLCNSPHGHYPMYKDYSQPRSQDGSQHSYETVFNEGYGRRPPLPVPRPPLSSNAGSQQYEPLMPIRRLSNPYDEVNEDLVPGTSERNEPDIMTSSRVDSLYIKGAPRTTL